MISAIIYYGHLHVTWPFITTRAAARSQQQQQQPPRANFHLLLLLRRSTPHTPPPPPPSSVFPPVCMYDVHLHISGLHLHRDLNDRRDLNFASNLNSQRVINAQRARVLWLCRSRRLRFVSSLVIYFGPDETTKNGQKRRRVSTACSVFFSSANASSNCRKCVRQALVEYAVF